MEYYRIIKGASPVIATAIHSGHFVNSELMDKFYVKDEGRFREEDPYTDKFIEFAPTRIIVNSSRFEFDLNRPENKAVYLTPADAWGLKIWRDTPAKEIIEKSLGHYKKFYNDMKIMLGDYVKHYKKIFVYDVHSYNHKRNGPDAPPENPQLNPDIIIGTGNIDSTYWRDLIDEFINDLTKFDFKGDKPDVRENVKFKGGYFSRWINQNFGNNVCVLSIEVKKTFMNEWTGEVYDDKVELITNALGSTMPKVLKNLEKKIPAKSTGG